MRIISQDGIKFDIEYENCYLVVNEKCCEIEAETSNPNFTPVMASYSSLDKCKKAMEMLRETYNPSRIPYNVANELNRLGIKVNPIGVAEFASRDMREKYFQFTQDSEIEVQQ